jgi:hypothetical protein
MSAPRALLPDHRPQAKPMPRPAAMNPKIVTKLRSFRFTPCPDDRDDGENNERQGNKRHERILGCGLIHGRAFHLLMPPFPKLLPYCYEELHRPGARELVIDQLVFPPCPFVAVLNGRLIEKGEIMLSLLQFLFGQHLLFFTSRAVCHNGTILA